MRNNKLYVLVALVVLTALLFTACQPAAEAEESGKKRVVFITEDPVGVNPYFISGLDGLERAKNELDVETKIIEGTSDPTTTEENLRAAVREKYDLYILMTFGFEDVLNEVAPENTDLFFVCIDCAVDQPNVLNIGFKSHESAYLLGIAAGLLTETGIVANIGPVEMPFMTRWTIPFADAAKYINPDVTVLPTLWVGDWADPATAKELAITLANQDADVINGVAAAGNPGVFEAAEELGFLTTGVDVNECPKAPGYIIDSALKRVDNAVFDFIKRWLEEGSAEGGFYDYGLSDGGTDLAVFAFPDEDTECVLEDHPDIIEQIREVRQQIIDGELVIPDPLFAE
jgi:basic membrane protein A